MRKEQYSNSQKRKKMTATDREREKARKCYEFLLKEGHSTEFQLRDAIGGMSHSSFYKLTSGILNENPFNTLLAVDSHSGQWYTPQREHYDEHRGEWVFTKKFLEAEEKTESKKK